MRPRRGSFLRVTLCLMRLADVIISGVHVDRQTDPLEFCLHIVPFDFIKLFVLVVSWVPSGGWW